MDWKDTLGSLLTSGALPEDTAEQKEPETVNDIKPGKKPVLNVAYERKGRGGKSATIIEGFGETSEEELLALASRLKSQLGIGGSARGGEILLQGDQRSPKLKKLLLDQGYKSKGL